MDEAKLEDLLTAAIMHREDVKEIDSLTNYKEGCHGFFLTFPGDEIFVVRVERIK